jgi:hypothetical protein
MTAIANDWWILAIGWHVALAALVISLIAGWRPPNRLFGLLLTAPLFSVSILAWTAGNPFNGTVFAILAAFLAAIAIGSSKTPIRTSTPSLVAVGGLMVLSGWVYPHFVTATSWLEYAYASPFGLLPCPTLSVIIGATIACGTLQSSRPWTAFVVAAGAVYGAIGVFVLGVSLDYFLLAGALVVCLSRITTGRAVVAAGQSRSKLVVGGTLPVDTRH